ncbi:MAG: FAD/NAD(P)-binding oxidoreductase [Methylotenera sp.]|nr:FAD/NAD(P)-binding oxidoreductase [Methylotenera sp.]MDD4927188.1 FAD/NAD(P)-binding oxidoreductase [Methylotenera sp.]
MVDQGNRRNFLKMSGVSMIAGTMSVAPSVSHAGIKNIHTDCAALPRAKGPRVVVVGAGTAGLTIAKYLKLENPKFDVVLVEKRDMYSSCFSSNLWYDDLIDLEFMAGHSFLDAAKYNNYIFFNATCIGLDRSARKVYTNQGYIDYEFLVLAPGIDYDYSRIGITDPDIEFALRTAYPGGFAMPTEHVTIRNKVKDFKGGIFIQTVPSGNYRCLPAPYERACMVAAYFKKHKIKAKVVILDFNPEITIKAKGFHAAFEELYKDYIEWQPSVNITGVDLDKKIIKTEFDNIPFDDASIYPGVRTSKMIEWFDLVDPKSTQKEANIDPFRYHILGDPHVYVAGDSRPMGFSKSANTSNTEGKYVAKLIAATEKGHQVDWVSPQTVCYSMVNGDPMEAIAVYANYVYDNHKQAFSFSSDTKLFQNRDHAKGMAALSWAEGIYRDLFRK